MATQTTAQTVVGTDVGISTLTQAQAQGLLLPGSVGFIDQSFTVEGDFEVSGNHRFRGSISLDGRLLLKDADIVFYGSTVEAVPYGDFDVENSKVGFYRSRLLGLGEMRVSGASEMNFAMYSVRDVFLMNVRGSSSVNFNTGTITNSTVTFRSLGELRIEGSRIENNPAGVRILQGNYIGHNNRWINNNSRDIDFRALSNSEPNFRSFYESNSIFTNSNSNPSNYHIRAVSPWSFTIEDCSFDSDADWAIQVRETGSTTSIKDIAIEGAKNGVLVHNSGGTICDIKHVSLERMFRKGTAVELIGNQVPVDIIDLSISNSDLAYGVLSNANAYLSLYRSYISDCEFGLFNSVTDYCVTHENTFFNCGSYGARATASDYHTHSCNDYFGNAVGFGLDGSAIGLFMGDNQFASNTVGLQYLANANATPQIHRGNDFVGNTGIDAMMLGLGGFNRVENNRYVTNASIPAEHASNNRTDWFINTGFDSYECNVFRDITDKDSDVVRHVKYLLSCLEKDATDCHCYNNQKAALLLIQDHPEVLNDPYIANAYQVIVNSPVASLPSVSNILNSVNYTIDVVFDTITLASDSIFVNAASVTTSNIVKDELVAEWYAEKMSKVDSVRSALQMLPIGPESSCAWAEREMLLYYLDEVAGDSLADYDLQKVVSTAESCIADKGEAVYLAQGLAHMYDVPFVENSNCATEGRASTSDSAALMELSFAPNPAVDRIFCATIKDGEYLAVDAVGQSSSIVFKSGSADVSTLSNGIYTVVDLATGSSGRFIKIGG